MLLFITRFVEKLKTEYGLLKTLKTSSCQKTNQHIKVFPCILLSCDCIAAQITIQRTNSKTDQYFMYQDAKKIPFSTLSPDLTLCNFFLFFKILTVLILLSVPTSLWLSIQTSEVYRNQRTVTYFRN